jgi:hemerythrin superfamily protein
LAPGAAERQRLLERIQRALGEHAATEERYFYPLLQDHAATKDLALEAMEEHEIVKNQLADLAALETDGAEWSARLESLRASVESHIATEEGELFERARRLISARKAEDLGKILDARGPTARGAEAP